MSASLRDNKTSGWYSFVDDKVVSGLKTNQRPFYEHLPSQMTDYNAYKRAWLKTPTGSASKKRSAYLWETNQYNHGVRVSLLDSAAVKQGASGTDSGF